MSLRLVRESGVLGWTGLLGALGLVLLACESASVECEFDFECEQLEACVAGLCVPPCEAGEHVVDGRCEACAAGMTSTPDQPRYGDDTSCFPILCAEDERVAEHACVPCGVGLSNAEDDDASGADTICDPILCGDDERVISNSCVPCPDGTHNLGGDVASGDDTSCDADACPSDYYVHDNACVACEPGTTRTAGDDPAGSDTSCDARLCAADQHVVDHQCLACAAGTTRPAGDDASGADTACIDAFCSEDMHVLDGACTACDPGTQRPAGDDVRDGDTVCAAIICGVDEHVVDHFCQTCEPGTTRAAGDDASASDTACEATVCDQNYVVRDHACEPCAAGSSRPAGDDASGSDTVCEVEVCGADAHVVAHGCEPCEPGTTRPAGDEATGADTTCDTIRCGEDEHVVANVCQSCADGTSNAAGDDASGDDTPCDASLCPSDYHVTSHACVPCAQGMTRAAGDDASGPDTTCEAILCDVDERVDSHACVPCPSGTTSSGGARADLDDTTCEATLCPSDEHVVTHVCQPCPPGMTNDPGDDASAANTTCDAVLCDADERVASHACVSCPPGATNPSGDDASGSDTVCAPVLCGEDEHVVAHACEPCPAEWFNEAGDDASGSDTACYDTCYTMIGVLCDDVSEAYVKASNTGVADGFGLSIAFDGDTLAVGAPGEASGTFGNPNDNSASAAGAVYLYHRGPDGWEFDAYLKAAHPGQGDAFGWDVALDGDVLVVGAPGEASTSRNVGGDQLDDDAPSTGAAYVFRRDADVWIQEAYLKAMNADAFDRFGTSVAVSGTIVSVGAPGEAGANDWNTADNNAPQAGAVYVFEHVDELGWLAGPMLKAPYPDAGDRFGESVALHAGRLVVGAPGEDGEGGIGSDQSANTGEDNGAVYVFESGPDWVLTAFLKPHNTGLRDEFGGAVDVHSETIVVGAAYEDSASEGIGGDGWSDAATDSGAVYVFQRLAGVWREVAFVKATNTGAGDRFGYSVALGTDTIAVGALSESSNSREALGGDERNDGAYASGAVYVLRRVADVWDFSAYLKAWNADAQDEFGTSVALDGSTVCVGAPYERSAATGVDGDSDDDSLEQYAGAAYVFLLGP